MVKNKKWLPLFITQFLGVLNDNVLKNAIIFISIFWLAEDNQPLVIPIASALLVLPFVLFSPLAGRWSQTKSKQRIFELSKLFEIPIMGIAVFGFFTESIVVVMIAMLLMGIQSAIYSPSKYGLIRDIGGVEGVSFGIGTMELLTFVGVLIGQVVTGLISDLPKNSIFTASSVMMVLAVFGYISSKNISAVEPEPTKKTGETINPLMYLYNSYKWSRSIKGLNYTILGLGGFWLVASMLQMNIYMHAPDFYGMSNTQTSIVMALIAIGIGTGCWVAGLIAKNRVEIGMVPIGGIALSACLTIFATTELSATNFTIMLFIAAFFSGFYKVPLNAWLQERVEGRKLGTILAYNNMVAFLFILVAAGLFGLVTSYFDTNAVFIMIAAISWIMTIITLVNIPAMMIRFVADAIARLYFKYDVQGAEYIPKKSGGLLIANHQSLIDPMIIVAAVPRMVRFVMAREIYENPFIHWFVKRMNVIPVTANLGKGRLEEFTRICQDEINQGHLVCIFPEGQISRIGHLLEFKKGVEHIAEGIKAPIIPLHLAGIKGTPFSFNVGSSTPIIRLKAFRKPISVSIGKPIYHKQSAFHLRQGIQELTTQTFERRIKTYHNLGYFFSKVGKGNGTVALSGFDDNNYSYAQLFKEINNLSRYLRSEFREIKTAGIYAHPGKDVIALNVSMAVAGITSININPRLEDENLRAVLHRCDVLFGDDSAEKLSSNHIPVHKIGDIMNRAIAKDAIKGKDRSVIRSIQKYDLATIAFEQDDKGQWIDIKLSHQNILACAKGLMQIFEVRQGRKLLSTMPLHTAYGYSLNVCLPLLTGMTIVRYNPTMHINELAATIIRQNVDILFAHAEEVRQLYELENDEVWKSIETIVTGKDAVALDLKRYLQETHEVTVHESIGVTEFGTVIAVSSPNYMLKDIAGLPIAQLGSKADSYGRPVPGIAVKVVDPNNTKQELGANEVGMLMLKGAALSNSSNGVVRDQMEWVMSGFTGVVDQDGFLKLGNDVSC